MLSRQQNRYTWVDWLFVLLTAIILLLTVYPLFDRVFLEDDWEHLASAWFIYNGFIPYQDFFQHHNPALWYLLAPVFYFLENPLYSFHIGRVISAFFFLGGLVVIGGILKRLNYNKSAILYTLFIYLTYPVIRLHHIQNRPDTPMMFFLLTGLYYWIRFYQEKRQRDITLCYLSFFISFFFLQKALLFLAPFGIYQLYLLIKKNITWKQVFLASLLPLAITFGYAIYLYQNGLLLRYWELNYTLNALVSRDVRTYDLAFYDYVFNITAFLLIVWGLLKGSGLKRQLLLVISAFSVIFLLTPKPFLYYWSMWTPFMSAVLGVFVSKLLPAVRFYSLLPAFVGSVLIFTKIWTGNSSDFNNLDTLRVILGGKETIANLSLPQYALLSKTPGDYYFFSVKYMALWDIDLFHRHEFPKWDQYVYQNHPLVVIDFPIYKQKNLLAARKKELIMRIDRTFLEKYYVRLPFQSSPGGDVWLRKN